MRETQDSRFGIIRRPPKVYLDTNHLINIAKVRKRHYPQPGRSDEEYRRIDECIKSYCGLIFNPYAALEWVEGNATAESASEIAAVVDSAKLKYQLEADCLIYTHEVLDQCCKQNHKLKVPDLPLVLQNISDNSTFRSSLGTLATQVPDYLEEGHKRFQQNGQIPVEIPIFSVREWVTETLCWKEKNPETYQERIDGFKAPLSEDIARKDEYFSDRLHYQRNWIKGFLKIDRILRAFNPGIDVDCVLKRIDVKDCPAVDLYWTVREKRMRSGNPPNDNDVDDYMYIPVIPYADVVLIEKQLRGFVL
ncbi:MAG: hypothetical protein ACYSW0_21305 [Planctomycetota bacterium]|jgi:hypothetical protein